MKLDMHRINLMTDSLQILEKLIENWESEVVEFKEASSDFNKNEIGKYFSALSNEANLRSLQYGWLVFGVRNKDRRVVGTNYRDTVRLEKLKQEISDNTTGGISFVEIYEVYPLVNNEKKRVILFQIPAATVGIPTGWNNHYYARNGESLCALSLSKQDTIRGQEKKDWSKQIVEGAEFAHLDKVAIQIARQNYKEKMKSPHIIEAVDKMTDEEFLTKIKLMVNGRITNAAMLLLGNEDYDYLFETVPEASWRLYDAKGNVKDYEIFKIPFITISDRIFAKIRNLTYRYMPNQLTLFPTETIQYDTWLLRELMNNCIAHSDYTIGGRIYLNEYEDELIFVNPGNFIPGSIEATLKRNYSSPFYRNQLLAETMVKFNMIDTQSMGIRKVFTIQQEKFFPLPDYDLNDTQKVSVTVYGKTIDENYTKLLFENRMFELETVFLIDLVQKHRQISKEAARHLRNLGVVEGRYPNLYLSANIAASLGEKGQYIRNKAFDNETYEQWIISYLKKFGKGKKQDFVELLREKMSDSLNDKQKTERVKYILSKMKDKGIITLDSNNKRTANWILKK